MPFKPFLLSRWVRGAILVGEPDQIRDDGFRRINNMRLDRTLGVPEVRPGWTQRTVSAGTSTLQYLSRLFVHGGIFGYTQFGGGLWRYPQDWSTLTATGFVTGATRITDANSPDGNGRILKYFVNETNAFKDDGTTTTRMGILPPANIGLTVSLAADLSTTIDELDNAGVWTGSGLLAGPTTDTTFFQESTGSVTISVAANTFGSMSRYFSPNLQLDTLTGGDNLVKNDDYIHLWVRLDHPEYVVFMQIDIDVDSATTGVSDAFRRNYYSIRIGSVQLLSQGSNQWTRLQLRKASFQRYGTDTARTWANVTTVRIGFQVNETGNLVAYLDDMKLRGGVGIEGDIEYTLCYRSTTTDARGNPPKDANGIVLYSSKVTTNRQRLSLVLTNIIQGGVLHPGDTQIDTIMLFRKGGTFTTAVLVDQIADTTAGPYVDDASDTDLLTRNVLLETDNDVPPTGANGRVLFGPDGSGAFYMIVDGYRLYRSKPYEDGENRVENWPALGFARVGDGSERAVAGIATATQVRVWTQSRSFQVVGIGEDVFLPVPIDGSHGCVGHQAVTQGEGQLFFVSQDGIYSDVNGRQTKLTGAIDIFFQGLFSSSEVGWNPALVDQVQLEFYNAPTGAMLVMLYADAASSVLNKSLVMKVNSETGLLTEAFFDYSDKTTLNCVFLDVINNELLAGGADGHVYKIEDINAFSDAGTAIPYRLRTKSYDDGAPQRGKLVSSAEIEGNTEGGTAAARFFYNRESSSEELGNVITNDETDVVYLLTDDPLASRRDIALELTGSATTRTVFTRLGWFVEQQPELRTFLDSGLLSFDFVQQMKRMEWDIFMTGNGTLAVYTDGTLSYTGVMLATTARVNIPYPLPPGIKGRIWRITLSATVPFLVYKAAGFVKQLGSDQQYTEIPLMQGI